MSKLPQKGQERRPSLAVWSELKPIPLLLAHFHKYPQFQASPLLRVIAGLLAAAFKGAYHF